MRSAPRSSQSGLSHVTNFKQNLAVSADTIMVQYESSTTRLIHEHGGVHGEVCATNLGPPLPNGMVESSTSSQRDEFSRSIAPYRNQKSCETPRECASISISRAPSLMDCGLPTRKILGMVQKTGIRVQLLTATGQALRTRRMKITSAQIQVEWLNVC